MIEALHERCSESTENQATNPNQGRLLAASDANDHAADVTVERSTKASSGDEQEHETNTATSNNGVLKGELGLDDDRNHNGDKIDIGGSDQKTQNGLSESLLSKEETDEGLLSNENVTPPVAMFNRWG